MESEEQAARGEAEALMDRVDELEQQWFDALDGMGELAELLQEARELMGRAREMDRKQPWQLTLGNLTKRLAVMDHCWKILLHEFQAIHQVDPLFKPDMSRVPRDGT